jgi:hypothetical protein
MLLPPLLLLLLLLLLPLLLLLLRTFASHSCLPSSEAPTAPGFEFVKSGCEFFLVGGRGCRLGCLLSDGLGAAAAAVMRTRDSLRKNKLPYI